MQRRLTYAPRHLLEWIEKHCNVVGIPNIDLPPNPVVIVWPCAHHLTCFGLSLFNDPPKVWKHKACPVPLIPSAVEDMEVVTFH